ncbi:hypothetical protein LX32DRAFT_691727 [Colletotrichum zoysiae]|uniref:Uncharacterized protein n=1 Tax=Colletotrichum zoysiae TaxID=1216348 RepID=A0AAD9HLG8_9PEZI|nr:hypothetical protein LX32DRAFT_691727 [Colletotrichum zoysiae]
MSWAEDTNQIPLPQNPLENNNNQKKTALMEIPQPVLKIVAFALSAGILVELVILARLTARSREEQPDWDPATGLSNTGRHGAHDDGEKDVPQRDTRMPPVDHTL